jgi:signal transduction histidine kinase
MQVTPPFSADPVEATPSPRSKIAALVVIAILSLVATTAASWADQSRSEAAAVVREAYVSSATLQDLLIAMLDTETGVRAYLLMGEPEYLEPYERSRGRIWEVVATLEEHFGDEREMAVLREHVEDVVELMDRSIVLADGDELAMAKQLADDAKRAMDAMREDIGALELHAERRRLGADEHRAAAASTARTIVITSTAGVVLMLLVLAAWIRRDLTTILAQKARLAERRTELAEHGARLEELTRELESRNAHLGTANDALAKAIQERAAVLASLERRNRDLDQFAYVTSHDLKAPLRAIGNLSSWIEEDLGAAATPEVREHLTLLRQRTERMNTLIEGILTYSRAGRDSKPSEVTLSSAVEHVVELLGIPAGGVVRTGDDVTLETDRVQLEQVLQNLVSNARKHAGEASAPIEISQREVGAFVEISVRDHGPGIEPRFHERIFEIFQTLAPRDRMEGTGIGLAIVKKVVLGQGGTIRVDSSPGAGATFTFTWPRRPGGAPSP